MPRTPLTQAPTRGPILGDLLPEGKLGTLRRLWGRWPVKGVTVYREDCNAASPTAQRQVLSFRNHRAPQLLRHRLQQACAWILIAKVASRLLSRYPPEARSRPKTPHSTTQTPPPLRHPHARATPESAGPASRQSRLHQESGHLGLGASGRAGRHSRPSRQDGLSSMVGRERLGEEAPLRSNAPSERRLVARLPSRTPDERPPPVPCRFLSSATTTP